MTSKLLRTSALASILAVGLANSGCTIITDMAGTAAGAAANQVGSAAGNRAGNAVVDSMGGPGTRPQGTWANAGASAALMGQMQMFYTQMIFQMAFGVGGYQVTTVDYKAGEFTRFNVVNGQDQNASMERAMLGKDAEGNEWWKVKYVSGEKSDTIILEALLSPKDSKMLRLRGKFPNDEAGKEMAVTDNAWYVPPQKLSPKSVEGATEGTEKVTVPAGSYTAKKVVFGDIGSTTTWHLVDSVPGGVVKQQTKSSQKGDTGSGYALELAAAGKDAKTELNTKL